MKYDVRFTDEAERRVREIREWIAERSTEGALRWLDSLRVARQQLSERAESFGLAQEADEFDEPLRQVLFKTRRGNVYRALFIVRDAIVFIVSVRGAGQPPVDADDIVMPE